MTGRLARRVALVGWSAADWDVITPLIDAGQMPAFRKLIETGVKGDLNSLTPMLRPLLWTSMVTGQPPERHGILGYREPDEATGATRTVSSRSRKVKAVWNIFSHSELRTLAVNWFASQPAEPIAGVVVSNLYPRARGPYGATWPLAADAVYPPSLSEDLAALRVHPGDFTGDDLKPFIPALETVDQTSDKRPLQLAIGLAETVTVHGAATWLMENQSWDLLAVCYDALGDLSQIFMPYHSPDRDGTVGEDSDKYRGVVSALYRYYDLLLARLIEVAGPETVFVVVSEHGFRTSRPEPIPKLGENGDPAGGWERTHGIFCAAGPGLRQDELVFGAGLLDIAPFLLALFGLPPGADMPGRILPEAFINPPSADRVATWEDAAPEVQQADEDWDPDAALAELASLGFAQQEPETHREDLAQVLQARDGVLAQVHLAARRWAEAIPLLETVLATTPSSVARMALAHCYQVVGRFDESKALVERVLDEDGDRPHAWLIRANLALDAGQPREAFRFLEEAERCGLRNAVLQWRLASVYARMGLWTQAEQCYCRAIGLDPRYGPAFTGRARALLELGRHQEAASVALDAVNLRFDDAEAHFLLGAALSRTGHAERAVQALESSLRFQPTAAAHRWLAMLYQKRLRDPEKAAAHRKSAAEFRA